MKTLQSSARIPLALFTIIITGCTTQSARTGSFHQTPRDSLFPGPVIKPRVKKKVV